MPFYGNILHLSVLLQAVHTGNSSYWNEWRERNRISPIELQGADFSGMDLSNFRLHNTDLSSANLSHTCLYEADLRYANLEKADLTGADLRKANLYQTNLSEANIDSSSYITSDGINATFNKTLLYEVSFSH